ncbi:MAG: TonB family protein [Bacteroidota bacterium]
MNKPLHPHTALYSRHASLLVLLVALITLGGCASDSLLSRGWRNFTAYYNTFYNAEEAFRSARKQVKDQIESQELNTERPIRIYPSPINAADDKFEKSIQKGALILRSHGNSKWVDDAILLIGKSYFYQRKYFSAEQKFNELFNASSNLKMRQLSIYWRGRTLNEMERYTEGIAYLSDQLNDPSLDWDDDIRYRTRAVLAELYTAEQRWNEAVGSLQGAPEYLEDTNTEARAYFLTGQLLDRQQQWHQAYQAFNQIPVTADYQLVYWGNRKRAEMARNVNQPNRAYDILESMRKDDKNLDRLPSIWYELARTEHQRGKIAEAMRYYKMVLRPRDQQHQPDPKTVAKTYYGLGELYQNRMNNFSLAAAYYDSAASRSVPSEQMPVWYDAEAKAEAFGAYDRLTSDIQRNDSLLWLGQLPEAEFDSVIAEIREQRRAELEAQMKKQQQKSSVLVTVDQQEQDQTTTQQATGKSGFLNIQDRAKLATAAQQFRAIWGDRPLVDHWRRSDEMQNTSSTADQRSAEGEKQPQEAGRPATSQDQIVMVDLSEIPFSKEAQSKMKHTRMRSTYELGNVFFINLELYDSASVRYRQVIDRARDSLLISQALFSLSEVQLAQQDTAAAKTTARQLIDGYPSSSFAERVMKRYDWEVFSTPDALDSGTIDEGLAAYRRLQEGRDTLSMPAKLARAQQLREIGESNISAPYTPYVYYDALQFYIEVGKEQPYYQNHISDWLIQHARWDSTEHHLAQLQDSLQAQIQDTTITLSDSVRSSYQQIIDSTLNKPDFSDSFPYLGSAWDSARVVLDTLTVRYIDNGGNVVQRDNQPITFPSLTEPLKGRVQRLQGELQIPQPLQKELNAQDTTKQQVFDCEELDVQLQMRGDVQVFADSIRYPEALQGMTLSGEVNVSLVVDEKGNVIEAQPTDRSSNLGLEESVVKALLDHGRFQPITHPEKGTPISVRCGYTVPIRLSGSR